MTFETNDRLINDKLAKFNSTYYDTNLRELDFIKMLMGLSNIQKDGNNIKLNTNYINFPAEKTKLTLSYIKSFLPSETRDYLLSNRPNNTLFESLTNELGLYFISNKKKSYLEAFVHLYRLLERMSIMFPLIYIKHNISFSNAYQTLKACMGQSDEQELKFLNNFQKEIFSENDIFNNCRVEFKFAYESYQEIELRKLFNESIHVSINDAEYEYNKIIVPLNKILNFFITIRNRYFHYSLKSNTNINNLKLDMMEFFKQINEPILNWIGLLYYEILKKSI